jgi:hypothetical protein
MKGKEEFKEFTDEEIHCELYRRDREKLKPKKLYNAVEHIKGHYDKLISTCEEYINNMNDGNGADTNDEHFIFEEALKAVYGNDIFNWINSNL